MWLFVIPVVVVLAFAGLGFWMLAPTLRTFRGPSFEPASKDEASVLRAQQAGMVDGGAVAGLPLTPCRRPTGSAPRTRPRGRARRMLRSLCEPLPWSSRR